MKACNKSMFNFKKKDCRLRAAIATATMLSSACFVVNQALADSESLALEEIIVTAQKRAESMQDVPIAVQAVTSAQLESSGVAGVENLGHSVSGLVINNSNSLLLPFIRGVGAYNANAASYSSVAVYLDGIYLSRSNGLAFNLDNIAQVEVLKGPQSTLYGRNATAGAISITTETPQPGDEVSGQIKAGFGNYGQQRYSGTVAGGLSDTFAASLTGSFVKRDGYVDNLAADPNLNPLANVPAFQGSKFEQKLEDEINSEDEKTIAAKLNWQPTDAVSMSLFTSYREVDDTKSFTYKQLNATNFANAFFATAPAGTAAAVVLNVPAPDDEHRMFSHFGFRDGSNTLINLSGQFDFDGMYLVSLTGYVRDKLIAASEVAALNLSTFGFAPDWDVEGISQEFRLHSDTDSALQWMVGAQYNEENDDASEIHSALGPGAGQPASVADLVVSTDWTSESYALFAEAVYEFNDAYSLTLGLRQTEEDFIINSSTAFAGSRNQDSDELTYRIVFDYQADWGLLYVSRSTGFVSGTLNVQNPDGDYVVPETLTSHEIGFKTEFADSRVRLNGALFDYDYEDIHAQSINGATGLTNLVAGQSATVRGVEFDMVALLASDWTANLGVTYLFDREYDEFDVPASGTDPFVDFPPIFASGNTIAGAPEMSLVASLAYDVSLSSGSRIESNLSVSYSSGVFYDSQESIGSGGAWDDGSYTLVNFSSTYHTASEQWGITLWVNNLLDEYYYSGGINGVTLGGLAGDGRATPFDSLLGIEGEPRMYGLTASYNF